MKNTFLLDFQQGLPSGTAQHKGERIMYKNGKPFIHHYRKDNVQTARTVFIYMLKAHRPSVPSEKPIRLEVYFYFSIKDTKKQNTWKTTRPDVDGYLKEFLDAMQEAGFFKDDSQVVDIRIQKRYAEKAQILVRWEELEE